MMTTPCGTCWGEAIVECEALAHDNGEVRNAFDHARRSCDHPVGNRTLPGLVLDGQMVRAQPTYSFERQSWETDGGEWFSYQGSTSGVFALIFEDLELEIDDIGHVMASMTVGESRTIERGSQRWVITRAT